MKNHTTDKRMRGEKLQKRNRRLAQEQPLCVECLKHGRLRPGTQSDHIIALCNGGSDTEDNLQRLCDDCHRDKTTRDVGYKVKRAIGLDGWPIEGSDT